MDPCFSSYLGFCDSQKEIVRHYPAMIEEELVKYEAKILRYFGISKDLRNESQVRDT
jgi:hypothetical protein